MGVIEHAHTRLNAESFFAFCDRHPNERWDLIEGFLWPHPFSSPTRGHQLLVRNIVRALERALPHGCRAEDGVSIRVDSANATFRQPDVLVTCDRFVPGDRFVDAPLVVFEVLSESTAGVDLLDKPIDYARIASLRVYVVVDSRSRRAFAFTRSEGFVQREMFETVDLGDGTRIALDDIYAGLDVR